MLRFCAHRIPLALSSSSTLRARPRRRLLRPSCRSRRRCRGFSGSKINGSCAMRRCRSLPPPATQGRRNVLPPPPPPPDLIRLLEDGEARIRRRAAIADRPRGIAGGRARAREAAANRHGRRGAADGGVWSRTHRGSIGRRAIARGGCRSAPACRRPRRRGARIAERHRVGARDRQDGRGSRRSRVSCGTR